MYFDHSITSRHGFSYPYKGAELVDKAFDRLRETAGRQREVREEVIKLTADPHVSPSDNRNLIAKKQLEALGKEVEELTVHAHQFRREPDRTFNLSLGDVVYFGLVDGDIRVESLVLSTPSGRSICDV